jgi:hypothetical protein
MEGVSKHQGNDVSEIHLTEIGLKRILARNGVRLASSGRVEVETKGISIGVDLTTELRRQEDSLDLGALLGVDYWLQVKQEIFELFCTNSKKYATLRTQLRSAHRKSQTVIVSLISTAIGAEFGALGGALVTLVTLAMLLAVTIGKEAYCEEFRRHIIKDDTGKIDAL